MNQHDRDIACLDATYQLLDCSLDDALSRLQAPRVGDESIHRTRKALKRARAALRLLRPGLSDAAFEEENAALRDVGRYLSPLRDSKALMEAYDELVSRHPEESQPVQTSMRPLLLGERLRARRKLQRPSAEIQECVRLLQLHRARLRQVSFRTVGVAALEEGFKRIYSKGRQARRTAEAEGTAEAFHEWRKQVKYLLNAVDGMKDALGDRVKEIGKQADELAGQLGDEHDLAVLSAKMSAQSSGRAMQAIISRQRAKLQKQALLVGKKLFDQKPKAFVREMLT